jgi:hypothetical protein
MNIPYLHRNQSRLAPMTRWAACLVLAAGFFAHAQSTDDSSATDFSSFQVIVQRNIFDPNRYPRENRQVRHHESGTPTFSLVGTMSYRKGMFAFFNGSSSDYQKAAQVGDTIAGYAVAKIDFDGVQLQLNGKETDMQVGSAMRQEGDGWELSQPGNWSMAGDTGSVNQDTNAAPALSLPTSGAVSDVLKRLMEQRAQQLK